jgi:hypothetical protein
MATITQASYWLAKLSKLRVDRARGDPAPHKPLLLRVLCDLAEKESLSRGVLPLSPEIAFRFYTNWSMLAARPPTGFCSGGGDVPAELPETRRGVL